MLTLWRDSVAAPKLDLRVSEDELIRSLDILITYPIDVSLKETEEEDGTA